MRSNCVVPPLVALALCALSGSVSSFLLGCSDPAPGGGGSGGTAGSGGSGGTAGSGGSSGAAGGTGGTAGTAGASGTGASGGTGGGASGTGGATGGSAGVGGQPGAEHTGEGTFYGADGSGNCSFDPSPNDLMVAAMNELDYADAAWCGGCVEITGPNGTVTVRIVDRCPECPQGNIDLSAEAFALIADPIDGRVPISWHEVACDVSGPIVYRFKEGSSQWWTAIQVRNIRYAIATLEVRINGTYAAIPRERYNYFVQADGLGVGPYDIRVTDVRGHVLEDSGIPVGDGTEVTGSGQFPP